MDPYEILKVRSDASNEELRRRKKELLVKYHPDKVQDVYIKELCEERCKNVSKAYEEIKILRKFKHPNQNIQRSDYYDMLFSMYPRTDLYDETFIDVHMETNVVFEELEAQMKRMKN